MTFDYRRVNPEALDAVWSELQPQVDRGLAHGQGDETESAFLKECVRHGKFQMWVALKNENEVVAGLILSVKNTKIKKVWVELLVGKNMPEWIDEFESLLADFRDLIGAQCIEASCRAGLAKYLKSRGWKQKAIIMSLEQ